MKRVVIYNSGTGFTEKYAKWIAEELGCDARPLKNQKAEELREYDEVIYGGWIMAGKITGYDKICKWNLKKVVVFGCGMTTASEEYVKKLAGDNQIDPELLFYFEGGYAPEKVGFFQKHLLNMIKKSLEKKQDKTEDELHTLETFAGADRTDRTYIEPLVRKLKNA